MLGFAVSGQVFAFMQSGRQYLSSGTKGLLPAAMKRANLARIRSARAIRSMSSGMSIDQAGVQLAAAEESLRVKGWRPSDRVVIFDGVCVMCNSGVDFLLRWDSQKQFKYAALQSDAGRALVLKYGAPSDLSTMVYVEDGVAHVRSEAVLRIGRRLGLPLRVPAQIALVAIPLPMRDWFYTNVVAKNRYDVFGKRDVCRIADSGKEDQFLN
jgi:predicted DCC family thiol-disulfide oxidoreductase YuxK